MKRYAIPFLLMAALASACSTRLHRHADGLAPVAELTAIDSLMWSRPDSAFAMLLSFAESHEVDSLDSYNEHYFHLLLSELFYKNDYTQTNRNELSQAVGYYDSLVDAGGARLNEGIVFLDARAHYINGVGFYERDSVVPACEQYMKALERMEERFSEKELTDKKAQFMAIAYTHLMNLFTDQYLHEQAIHYGKQSLPYYHKHNAKPWHESWVLEAIGAQYDMMEEWDSAYHYYMQAYKRLPDTTGITFRDVKAHLLLFSSKKGLEETQDVLSQFHSLISNVESERELYSRCLTIGDVFYCHHQYDSAWVYLSKVFNGASGTAIKKQAAEWLVEICKDQGRESESLDYIAFLAPFANQEENQSANKTQLTKLYQQYENTRQLHSSRGKTGVMKRWGRSIFFIICFLALGASAFLFLNRKKQVLAENNWKAKEAQQSATLAEYGSKIRCLQMENNELKEKSDSESKHDKASAQEYENLLREKICLTIRNRMKKAQKYSSYDIKEYKVFFLSFQERSELIRVIDIYCPGFQRELKKRHPELNRNDILLCRFYLLDLSILQTAILLGTDYSSIRKRTSRLKEKIGDSEIHQYLKSLFFAF